MPHLFTFSFSKHSLYTYDESSYYDSSAKLAPAYAVVDGVPRRYNLTQDITNPSANFSGSAFRQYVFPQLAYNNNPIFRSNFFDQVDITGVSIRPASIREFSGNLSFPDENGNVGIYNYDNWNSNFHTLVLLTPRHALMCGHCWNYCNQAVHAIDPEDFTQCCCADDNVPCGICDPGEVPPFIVNLYTSLKWMNKDNQIIEPFNNLTIQEFYQAFLAKDYTKIPRIRNLSDSNFGGRDVFLLEFPFDISTPSNKIKYYNKIILQTAIPNDSIVYVIKGSNVGYRLKKIGLSIENSVNDGLNNSFIGAWKGDSGSPIFIRDGDGSTVFAGVLASYGMTIGLVSDIITFIRAGNSGYEDKIIIYLDVESSDPPVLATQYFGNANTFSILGGNEYLSRFSTNELTNKNYNEIAFMPGNALQASELNEMQDLFHRQITLSNKFLSIYAVDHIINKSSLFLPEDDNYSNPGYLTYYIPERQELSGKGYSDGVLRRLWHYGWYMYKHESGLHFYQFFAADTSTVLRANDTPKRVDSGMTILNYTVDPDLIDPISDFYGASRLTLTQARIYRSAIANIVGDKLFSVNGIEFSEDYVASDE
jgi:hypothetical protein